MLMDRSDIVMLTGPCSAVPSESDGRSRGHEFDPCPVPYFMKIDGEIISMVIFLLQLIQEGLLSVTSERNKHEVLVNCLFKLAKKKRMVKS